MDTVRKACSYHTGDRKPDLTVDTVRKACSYHTGDRKPDLTVMDWVRPNNISKTNISCTSLGKPILVACMPLAKPKQQVITPYWTNQMGPRPTGVC
jgi:hypothetical protein